MLETRLWAVRLAGTLAVLTVTAAVQAQQISLTPASVIGGSGAYSNSAFNAGQYAGGFIFDQQGATAIDESDQNNGDANGGYWLGRDGQFSGYLVIDLGATFNVTRLDLYNTHNAFFNDRGTRDFQIFGSNTVTDTGGGNFDLVGASSILTGTLAYQTNDSAANPELTAQTFFTGGVSVRYLRFNALNQYPIPGGSLGVGLNELKVFQGVSSAAPEPGALFLLGGGLATGRMLRRRRHS